jgi:PIN like domain
VPRELRERGWLIEAHDDHFPPDTKDLELLPELGRLGWVLLTQDARIRYRAAEREAYMQAGLRIFVLTAASLGSAETIGILLTAESHIRRVLDDDDGPFMYRVGKNGRVARLQ